MKYLSPSLLMYIGFEHFSPPFMQFFCLFLFAIIWCIDTLYPIHLNVTPILNYVQVIIEYHIFKIGLALIGKDIAFRFIIE